MVAVSLGTVQETLLLTLAARAWDAKRARPVLGDEQATGILRGLDFDFGRFGGGTATSFGIVARAAVLEAEVAKRLAKAPDALVVELGAGLSSRYERLDNGRAYWIDIDLPDSLALRRQFFEEAPRRSMIAASVLDEDWIAAARRAAEGRAVVFVAEGLLPYLEEQDVQRLLKTIHREFPGAWLVFDSTSTGVVAMQRYLRTLKGTKARFSWGLRSPEDLASWESGYRVHRSISLREALDRVGLPMRLRAAYRALDLVSPSILDGYRVNVLRLGVGADSRERAAKLKAVPGISRPTDPVASTELP